MGVRIIELVDLASVGNEGFALKMKALAGTALQLDGKLSVVVTRVPP
jgi:hypothetical protein